MIRGVRNKHSKITEDTPLTPFQELFVSQYITGQSSEQIIKALGLKCKGHRYDKMVKIELRKPNVQKRIREYMEEMKKATIMTGEEVMEYFTAVARGEIKDQFGLDAPLSERTAAAKEIAKRTIDVELKKEGIEDRKIDINLNWDRS